MWETIVVGMEHYNKQIKFSVDEESKWEGEEDGYVGYQLENEITLKREPDNKYDKHAVQVLMDEHLIGYIPKEDARIISEKMDRGIVVEVVERPFILIEDNQFKRLTLRLRAREKGGKKTKEDSSQRILCSDGNCIGTINENGVCNICGKPHSK